MKFANTISFDKARYEKIIHWARLITITGSAQILIQAIALVSGILIIRILPTSEYALYTLVNTMLGTMTVLADGGISAGVMAQGGGVWQQRDKLGSVMVTGLNLRKKFAIVSLLVALPILFYLLLHHGASLLKATIIVLCLIPAFTAALSDSLLEISLKLRQDINPLQRNQIWVNVLRLIFIAPMLLTPWAGAAILLAGIPRMMGNFKLRKLAGKHVDWSQKSDPEVQKQILSVVRRIMPGCLYFCFSSQLTIWLMSLFGATAAVAQLGALSRISLMLTVIGSLFNILIVPRFARLPNEKKSLLGRYFGVIFLIAIINGVILMFVWFFPTQILWILGDRYKNLDRELFLCLAGSCLMLISSVSYSLYTNRGWVINPIIGIPLHLLIMVGGLFFLNVRTLDGVLIFNIVIEVVNLFVNVLFGLTKILKLKT